MIEYLEKYKGQPKHIEQFIQKIIREYEQNSIAHKGTRFGC